MAEAEIHRGDWISPNAGKIALEVYATQWIDDRVLKPRTEGLYRGLLRNHLLPTFGGSSLSDIKEPDVRRWRKERLGNVGQSTVAKAYQLLKSILSTAVDDELIRRSPCRIKGAGTPDTPEGEMIPLTKVYFHDLRCVGSTLAASTGASLKELMTRMGHASPRAVLIYQHATRDRDEAIAQALGEAFKTVRGTWS